MHIARVTGLGDTMSWAVVDPQEQTAREIKGAFEDWATLAATGSAAILVHSGPPVPLKSLTLRAPRVPGSRVFGVGMNYLSHLTRLGRTAPVHSIAYLKPDSAIVDPGGEIAYPPVTNALDFEIELVAVMARPLGDDTQASSCLLGYTIGNDVSARDAGKQIGMTDLFTQKALDATTPLGPWITTLDACGGPGQPELNLTMRINGELRQSDNSREMIFTVDELLNFVDARVQLRAGDVIFTGSTCGVGLEDGRFLQPADLLEASIEGIGTLRNHVGPKRTLSPSRKNGRLGLPETPTPAAAEA